MTAKEIRQKFLDFFIAKGHLLLPSFSLVPENDPTLLLVNSGMVPLKPYFLGLKESPSKRLVDIQKCIRMEDVEKVGVSAGTLTFFEMMGNWSIGDYGKKEALAFAWDLLVKGFGFSPAKLWATVFGGEGSLPPDTEAIEIWKKLGLPEERIIKLGMDDNFWVSGPTGPCGPCSEVFYDLGEEKGPEMKGNTYNRERLFEIWNACVFIQYNRDEKGIYQNLPFFSIDAGAGVERFSMVLQKKKTVFETDLFLSIIRIIEQISGKSYKDNQEPMQILADHLKAAVFLAHDGLEPSNKQAGYVMRRLIRRAVVKMLQLGINPLKDWPKILQEVFNIYKEDYLNRGELEGINTVVGKEIETFLQTINKGTKLLQGQMTINGKLAFDLYQSYGFPLEITLELLEQWGKRFDEEKLKSEFNEELKKHQELSRTTSAGMFRGGLADNSEVAVKYHTATHLLQAALKKVLGDHVHQAGSNITAERIRFDFPNQEKLTPEQLLEVEKIVNEQITKNLEVKMETMGLEKAKKIGALTVPGEKYPVKVKVYTIGVFSKEVCGGPHVDFTGRLGRLKIIKEESAGAGIRRIYAVLK